VSRRFELEDVDVNVCNLFETSLFLNAELENRSFSSSFNIISLLLLIDGFWDNLGTV